MTSQTQFLHPNNNVATYILLILDTWVFFFFFSQQPILSSPDINDVLHFNSVETIAISVISTKLPSILDTNGEFRASVLLAHLLKIRGSYNSLHKFDNA